MSITRAAGPLTVTALQDAEGPFFEPREAAFPAATAAQWAAADEFDPAARTADGRWWLRFRSFAVRYGDGPVTLVDAGIGPATAPANTWAPVPGRLPAALTEAGITPDEVTAIVLTHLHTDHIGWAMPMTTPFPQARVIVQRADVEAFARVREEDLFRPLREQDRLEILDGDADIARGMTAVAAPGHTPGHQCVLVNDELLITGDLLVHAIQLLHPDLGYRHDMDADTATATRKFLFGRGLRLASSHLGEAYPR